MRPPGRTRAASAGASSDQRIGEDVGDDDVERAVAATARRPATNVASTPLRVRIGAARDERLRIDVDADDAAGAELARGDREDARAAAVVEHRLAAAQLALEPLEAQPRRRMDPVPNASPGSSARLIARRIDGVAPARHDPQPSAIRMRPELRLRRAHPVLSATVDRSRAAAARGAARRAVAASAAAIGRRAANSAVKRLTGHACAARLAGLVEQRRFVGGAGMRVRDIDRQRAGVEQRVAQRRRRRRRRRSAMRRSSCSAARSGSRKPPRDASSPTCLRFASFSSR